jgi:aromatic-L-amino-acid/L-tryptophan decarboxylase
MSTPAWTWTPDEIRRVGYRVADLIADHLAGLRDRPVFQPLPPELARRFQDEPAPAQPTAADAILDEVAATVAAYPFGNGHPRFAGWVNSPPAVLGAFADGIAAAINPSVAGGNHSAVHVEHQVLRWFRDLLGFPAEAAGLLVSGGSMASLTGLAVARHVATRAAGVDVRAHGLQGAGRPFVLFTGEEGHSCLGKAAELLGLGSDHVRTVPSDSRRRLRPDALDERIRRALDEGAVPIAVAASAGTVNTGAIDPLDEIADVCARHGVWLHVDAAYGGPAILSERAAPELEPLARADSVALDPHKWLYVPLEAGLVLVRDGGAMREAFSTVPPYLRTDGDAGGVGGPPWFSEFGFQQSRGFRALKVWMCLRYFGLDGYRALIDHDLDLADHLATRVEEHPDLELVARGLSIVCFRYAPPDQDPERLDGLNRALLTDLQLGGEAFLTSTVLDGRFVLRACLVNPGTTPEDVDALLTAVRKNGALRRGR